MSSSTASNSSWSGRLAGPSSSDSTIPPASLATCHLLPRLARSTGLAPVRSPLTARRLAESTLTRDQSSNPAAPSSSSSTSCRRSNTPTWAHSANRRQQVVTLPQPNSLTGSSAHGVEVRAMNTIAAMQARSDTVRGAPPPGGGAAPAGCAPTTHRGADGQQAVSCPSRSQARAALVTRTSAPDPASSRNHPPCLRECPLKEPLVITRGPTSLRPDQEDLVRIDA